MNFKRGEIVKHVLENVTMVIIEVETEREEKDYSWNDGDRKVSKVKVIKELKYRCRYWTKDGGYFNDDWFHPEELKSLK